MNCKRCSLPIPGSLDRIYCSKKCYGDEKRERDTKNKRSARNLKKTIRVWKERNPNVDILPAWPHRFGDNLLCDYCNSEWSDNQGGKLPICTNPQVYMEIRFNIYGRPKLIKKGKS